MLQLCFIVNGTGKVFPPANSKDRIPIPVRLLNLSVNIANVFSKVSLRKCQYMCRDEVSHGQLAR